jgi:hypothetical protein
MGCNTVEFQLPFALNGVRRFFTTNGHAFLSRDGKYLYLRDSVVLVRIDPVARAACSYRPDEAPYIDRAEETDTGFDLKISDRRSMKIERSYTMEEMGFVEGMGPVEGHLFPSAWEPNVRGILESTELQK